jgi:hypothetical protein
MAGQGRSTPSAFFISIWFRQGKGGRESLENLAQAFGLMTIRNRLIVQWRIVHRLRQRMSRMQESPLHIELPAARLPLGATRKSSWRIQMG